MTSERGRVGARSAWSGRAAPLAFAVASAALCAGPGSAVAELAAVWAVDDGTKIPAEADEHPLAGGNGVFTADPPAVRLFGLRNETVAFQVILVGGREPTAGVSLSLDAIGPIDNTGARDDPDRYWVDRHIEIFTQHYLDVRTRSHDIPWLPDSEATPDGPTGLVPDALVPHRRPVEVPAGRNQGFWVDLYIPRDAPAGVHRGTLHVRVDGAVCGLPGCRLPIELEILPVALPDEPPVRTMLAASGVDEHEFEHVFPYYFDDYRTASAEAIEAIRRRHFLLARRYRVTLLSGSEDEPTEPLRRRLSGEAFSREAGYTGPGEGLGQDLYAVHIFGGALTPDEARRWHEWLGEHGPGADSFLYVVDEPSDDARIPEHNRVAREAEPIDAFVTHPYDPRFIEFDVFAAPSWQYERADEARAAGVAYWVYNGRRPYSGTFMIDDVAISPRVNPWIQYRRGVPRWFYWEATYYNDFQGGRGHIDVWREPVNFSNRHGDRLNGDGLLMYPGRSYLFPDSDQGIDAPLPSIRLANWRRGIEDVGYLALARAAGHDALVDRLLDTLIPRALDDDVHDGEPVSWPEDGERWLRARRILFETLARGQPPADIDWAGLGRPADPWLGRARRALRRWADPLLRSPKRRTVTALISALVFALIAFAILRLRQRRRQAQGRRPTG